MNALVVGYGSIGKRHTRILGEMGCKVGVVSRQEYPDLSPYRTIGLALQDAVWDMVVIANRTTEHYGALTELIRMNFTGLVLVEKPLFEKELPLGQVPFERMFVSYNLRFHPAIDALKNLLAGERPVSAQFYVGQYLPSWRPGEDYRKSYSASRSLGGGALRDLSHELDLMQWLLGEWTWVTANGGTFGRLEIDSDDVYTLLVRTRACPAINVQLNYLDRITNRHILVNTDRHTYKLDFIANTLNVDGTIQHFETERDTTYRELHRSWIRQDFSRLCTFEEGLDVIQLIEAAEKAANRKAWFQNETLHDMR